MKDIAQRWFYMFKHAFANLFLLIWAMLLIISISTSNEVKAQTTLPPEQDPTTTQSNTMATSSPYASHLTQPTAQEQTRLLTMGVSGITEIFPDTIPGGREIALISAALGLTIGSGLFSGGQTNTNASRTMSGSVLSHSTATSNPKTVQSTTINNPVLAQVPQGATPQQAWRQMADDAFAAQDWNRLWQLLWAAQIGGFFSGMPVASYLLRHFLNNTGEDIYFDYVALWPFLTETPVEGGLDGGWIRNAPATQAKVSEIENDVLAQIQTEVAQGRISGTISTRSYGVQTTSQSEPDLYHALGQFSLRAEVEYEVIQNRNGQRVIRIQPIYHFSDEYDWHPERTGGILPHRYPWMLEQQGMASSYSVGGRWRGAEREVPVQ